MSVQAFSKTGTKATTSPKLDKDIFGLKVTNHELLKQAYISYLANGRQNLAQTLKRGQVRGGGKKPWKQKGTGRARFGSSRVPIWRGGGITFGPTGDENYTKKMHTNAKRLAIRQALSLSVTSGKLKVVETFANMDGKTKDMVTFLTKVEAKGKVLCVVVKKDVTLERATQNIPNLKVSSAKYLNVFDILNADNVIISRKSIDIVQEWLGKKTASTLAKEVQK